MLAHAVPFQCSRSSPAAHTSVTPAAATARNDPAFGAATCCQAGSQPGSAVVVGLSGGVVGAAGRTVPVGVTVGERAVPVAVGDTSPFGPAVPRRAAAGASVTSSSPPPMSIKQ